MVAHGDAQAAFQGHGAVGAVRQAGVAVIGADDWLDRVELHHAGRRIAAEQRALRTAQHFQTFQIEDREALQEHVFLHHVVIDQRHRLRGIGIEVGIAVAADVHAREHTAVGRFDIEAGRLAGQHTDVRAAGGDGIQEFRAQHRCGDRHVLESSERRSTVTLTASRRTTPSSLGACWAAAASGRRETTATASALILSDRLADMGRTPDSGGGAARPACRSAAELTRFTQIWQSPYDKVSIIRGGVLMQHPIPFVRCVWEPRLGMLATLSPRRVWVTRRARECPPPTASVAIQRLRAPSRDADGLVLTLTF